MMATSQKLTDHFLTCVVCTEVFRDPATLQCNHTFCRKCVVDFTRTKPKAVNAKSLACPVCSELTKVKDPSKPLKSWADGIKPLFVMQSLLDSFGPQSKDTTHCAHCKDAGETTLADGWCSVCDDALCHKCILRHKRIPATRRHDVRDLSDEAKPRKRKIFCKEHPTELVEFHCRDCNKAVCQKCCIIYHRKCETVVTLESEMEQMKTSLNKSRESFMKKEQETKASVDQQKQRLRVVTSNQSDIEAEIRSTCQKAIDRIKEKEERLLSEVADVTRKQTDDLKADIKTGEMMIHMYQQQRELIDQAVKSDSEMDIFEMYRSYQSQTGQSIIDERSKDVETVARFSLNQDISKLNEYLDQLHFKDVSVTKTMNLNDSLVKMDSFNIKMTDGKWDPDPTDLTVLEVNDVLTVVVCDCRNNCIKSIYRKKNKTCHSKLSLDNWPWSLTQIQQNQVAVTVPNANQIVFVEVSPDLKMLPTIKTRQQYWGITALSPTTLAVGSVDPSCIDILDMSGAVIRSLAPFINNQPLLCSPWFLCTTENNNILVSDRLSKSVSCLTPRGDIVFHYSPAGDKVLKSPRGVTVTNTGDILVCNFSLHCVLHLTELGQFVRNILTSQDGISNPHGICTDQHGKMYVCNRYDGLINVYK